MSPQKETTIVKEQRFYFDLMKHWPIILFIGTSFISWGIFSNKVQNIEAKVAVLETSTTKNTDNVNDIKVSLGKIQTSLDYITEKLSK